MREEIENYGQIIKSARIEAGYSRDDLAERVGISPRYLQSIENKNQIPSFKILSKLVRELNISLDNVIYPEKNIELGEKTKIIEKIYLCDENSLCIIDILIDALLRNQKK